MVAQGAGRAERNPTALSKFGKSGFSPTTNQSPTPKSEPRLIFIYLLVAANNRLRRAFERGHEALVVVNELSVAVALWQSLAFVLWLCVWLRIAIDDSTHE